MPAIYRRTGRRDIRRDLFFRLASMLPARFELMRIIAALEADVELRSRYEKVLAAIAPGDVMAQANIDVYSLLYR